MKGIVFSEFLIMVEKEFGFLVADAIINESNLPSGGAYNSVGTYDHKEMYSLVERLSAHTQIEKSALYTFFGKYLFNTLIKMYPEFKNESETAFDFLEKVETYIHVEVKKLYKDAELPTFQTNKINDSTLEMIYQSKRRMEYLGKGLIEGCLQEYNEAAEIKMEEIEGEKVRILIIRN